MNGKIKKVIVSSFAVCILISSSIPVLAAESKANEPQGNTAVQTTSVVRPDAMMTREIDDYGPVFSTRGPSTQYYYNQIEDGIRWQGWLTLDYSVYDKNLKGYYAYYSGTVNGRT